MAAAALALGGGAAAVVGTLPEDGRPAAGPAQPTRDPNGPADAAEAPGKGHAAGAAPARPAGPVVNGRRQPAPVDVPESATGAYTVVPGTTAPPRGTGGPVVEYLVEVERGLPFTGGEFAARVHRILNDPRGWGHGGAMRFRRVAEGPVRFRVSLSTPALTDRECAPLITGGELSCREGERSVINALRWAVGDDSYGRDVLSYREYLINHEVGHALGHGHRSCPGAGERAPVMVQQTKSLYGCRPNPWPHPRE
ncbi:membrane protein [Actinomadura cremea]|nr:membrane protein [Actinomadura cremea]